MGGSHRDKTGSMSKQTAVAIHKNRREAADARRIGKAATLAAINTRVARNA